MYVQQQHNTLLLLLCASPLSSLSQKPLKPDVLLRGEPEGKEYTGRDA